MNTTKVALETGLFIGSFHAEQATFLFGPLFGACAEWYTEPEWGCPLLTMTKCDSHQCVLAEQETTSD
ncbi:hypothetical protein EMCRGX_G013309 [Ephydatia muelleri]